MKYGAVVFPFRNVELLGGVSFKTVELTGSNLAKGTQT